MSGLIRDAPSLPRQSVVTRITCFTCDERHPRPGKKSKTDDEDKSDEEDLNEANYDEVRVNPSNIGPKLAASKCGSLMIGGGAWTQGTAHFI